MDGCRHDDNAIDCDDNNTCTTNDVCAVGKCQGVGSLECDDDNQCTKDICLPEGGCEHENIEGACSDDNPCTVSDFCLAGICQPGESQNCDDNNPCTDDLCNDSGGCENTPNAAPCTDNNECTLSDYCNGGVCDYEELAKCDDGNSCTTDSCHPDTGCVHEDNALPCNDQDACTIGDVCLAGKCLGEGTLSCDDGNVCTDDSCDAGDGCRHQANAESCDDGNACTEEDFCADGSCQPGTPLNCDDGNLCTNDTCEPLTGCGSADNTAPCNDGNACTTGDICDGGSCTASGELDCFDDNPCTSDSCDPESGCLHDNNTGECTDGNLCTDGDVCEDGTCVPGPTLDCNDEEICTSDSCDPVEGCINVNNSVPCNDGSACTAGDTCSDGTCGGSEIDCDDSNPCTDDSCNLDIGCLNTPNSDECDDGNECTENEMCSSSTCEPGDPVDCDDANVCTTDSCNPLEGCVNTDNAAPCDDGDACTNGDVCADGECGGVEVDCDDNNPCTDDSCNSDSGCAHDNNTDGCNDNNECTIDDACADGACAGNGSLECDDTNPCTKDICLADGGCAHENIAGACDDDNPCTLNDYCDAGACQTGPAKDCDDNNPCTDDTCNADGDCENISNQAPCTDNSECTSGDHCEAGVCVYDDLVNCDDSNICTADSCNPASGCVNLNNSVPCDDDNACTTGDICSEGACNGPGTLLCNDANPCTDDTCNTQSGCVYTNNVVECDDGNACTTGETCAGGTCVLGETVNCDDSNICTNDFCHPVSGCANQFNTSPCDDANACTTGDICSQGACTSTGTLTCNDNNPCTTDTCSADSGCANAANEEACDDGNLCTTNACVSGQCVTTQITACTAMDDCHFAGTCDPTTGVCSNPARPDNTGCDDSDLCTQSDLCLLGICVGGDDVVCTPSNDCHSAGECDPNTGACSNPVLDNGTDCDDGDGCTLNEACLNGECVEAGAPHQLFAETFADNAAGWTLGTEWEIGPADAGDCIVGADTEYFDPATDHTATADNGLAGADIGGCYAAEVHAPYCLVSPVWDIGGATGSVRLSYWRDLHTDYPTWVYSTVEVFAAGAWVELWAVSDGGYFNDAGWTYVTHDVTAYKSDDFQVRWCFEVALDNAVSRPGWSIDDVLLEAIACTDNTACTENDVCTDDVCAGTTVDCNDSNVCTIDSCDPVLGCQYVNVADDTSCDDGNFCNGVDTCQAGACTETTLTVTCAALDDCHDIGTCDVDTGECSNPEKADDTDCDDSSACTSSDTCLNGVCAGLAVDCDDSNVCTDDTCDPVTGCSNDNQVDGTECTAGGCADLIYAAPDTCQSGVCTDTGTADCDDSNICTDDACDPATGCSNDNQIDGTECAAGSCADLIYSTPHTCQTGVCTDTGTTDCNDSDVCTADSCDGADGCAHSNAEDGTVCAGSGSCNGLVFTSPDTCQSGTCTVVGTVECNDQNPCTNDSCDAVAGCVNQAFDCLVINEVDYDQPGDDTAEFFEILNTANQTISLSNIRVELVNGATSEVYTTYELSGIAGSINAGQYMVIGAKSVVGALGGNILTGVQSGAIQNGSPDGLRIVTTNGAVIDGVSYEGTMEGTGEGTNSAPTDSDGGSICRCPNGSDTNQNGDDFFDLAITSPGLENVCATPITWSIPNATGSSATHQPGVLLAQRIDVQTPSTIDSIVVEVSNYAGETSVRLGLYNDLNGIPGTLVVESPVQGVTSSGEQEVPILITSVAAGNYWLAAVWGSVSYVTAGASQTQTFSIAQPVGDTLPPDLNGAQNINTNPFHAWISGTTP